MTKVTPTPTPTPTPSSLKDWLSLATSILSFVTIVLEILFKLPSKSILLIALIIFVLSGVYYLYRLYKNGKFKALWRIFVVFYIISVVFAFGGSWYYFTQYDPEGFPLEKAKNTVYFYSASADNTGKGSGYLGVGDTYNLNQFVMFYDLSYSIPNSSTAYAGFAIEFFQPIDLTPYKSIQMTIRYGDPDALVRLFLKDDAKNYESVVLDDQFLHTKRTSSQLITVPLSSFQKITLGNVREMDIDANSIFITGDHEVWISGIHFKK